MFSVIYGTRHAVVTIAGIRFIETGFTGTPGLFTREVADAIAARHGGEAYYAGESFEDLQRAAWTRGFNAA